MGVCYNRRNHFLTCDSYDSYLGKSTYVVKMIQYLSTLWVCVPLLLLVGLGWEEASL